MSVRLFILGVACWLLAVLQVAWVAPQLERLPADYADEMHFDAQSRLLDTATGKWSQSRSNARRMDQTLVSSARHSIIQGDLHWTGMDGQVEFENSNIYGVDRYTRANLTAYGNLPRGGAFLFPPRLKPGAFNYWDPAYAGPRAARFRKHSRVDDVDVLEFAFSANALDETSGYTHLPEVPERYLALTDGRGTLWIESLSGILVDYQESGTSFFAEPATRRRVGPFFSWEARYNKATREAKLAEARKTRRWMLLLERVLPLAFLIAGGVSLLLAWRRRSWSSAPSPAEVKP